MPTTTMQLTLFANNASVATAKDLSRQEQKELGQFMTPASIARVMAARVCEGVDEAFIKVLEPSAGGGILAAAVVEELLRKAQKPTRIELTLCEIDGRLQPALTQLAAEMRLRGQQAGVEVQVNLRIEDFLLSDLAVTAPRFDIVIANPPYFKLGKRDPRAVRHSYAVHGQPNIYGLFMAACARVLRPQGRWCFITPRSWTNGPYFAATRRQVLSHLTLDALHVFESRQDHFTGDEILQEAMITWATAQAAPAGPVAVSTSQGTHDLPAASSQKLPYHEVVGAGDDLIISLPLPEESVVLQQFTATLATYDLKVSTGPVVAFRAAAHLAEFAAAGTVPLLWMQHITHMRVAWPIRKKREHIRATAATAWMLVPNQNMVVMRRFSPKEDQRRITAAPYLAGSLPGAALGLENHTNYLYRPGSPLTAAETRGLCAYLNSRAVDGYLRTVAGNTQINAADLRALPLPPLNQLVEIGGLLLTDSTLKQADEVVEAVLSLHFAVVAA